MLLLSAPSLPRVCMMAQISPITHSVNKPSLLTSLFKKPRGFLLLALTLYGCLHVQHLSFLCMSLLELFSCSRFLSTLMYLFSLCKIIFICLLIRFFFFLKVLFPSPSSFPSPMHSPYPFSQRGTSLAIGSLIHTSWVGVGLSERKIKAIPFIVRFPLFLLWESRAHRMDSEHGALLLSRITTGNVFPCDVTVNNFSAKGNKSVDFGAVCVGVVRLLRGLFTEVCTSFTYSEFIICMKLQSFYILRCL